MDFFDGSYATLPDHSLSRSIPIFSNSEPRLGAYRAPRADVDSKSQSPNITRTTPRTLSISSCFVIGLRTLFLQTEQMGAGFLGLRL